MERIRYASGGSRRNQLRPSTTTPTGVDSVKTEVFSRPQQQRTQPSQKQQQRRLQELEHQRSALSLPSRMKPRNGQVPERSHTTGPSGAQQHHNEATGRDDLTHHGADDRAIRYTHGIRDIFGRWREERPARRDETYGTARPRPEAASRGDRRSLYVPVEQPRAVSQPATLVRQTTPIAIPRNPSYPPADRRRPSSARTDALADENEFHLFAEATAGLDPESFRFIASGSSPRRRRDDERGEFRRSAPSELISPPEQTPTTISALQQLAQMPESTYFQPAGRATATPSPTFDSDIWTDTPTSRRHRTNMAALENFHLEEDYRPLDEELPDYAQSQAQAQAHVRAEATRRAQELQRRWQLSGSRRGCY